MVSGPEMPRCREKCEREGPNFKAVGDKMGIGICVKRVKLSSADSPEGATRWWIAEEMRCRPNP